MLTPLEKAALDMLLDRPGEPYGSLRQQLTHASVAKRDFTGVGFFTEFALPADAPVRRDLPDTTIHDVGADVVGVEHGVGFVLFVRAGVISVLEGYTYTGAWPEVTDEFRVYRLQTA